MVRLSQVVTPLASGWGCQCDSYLVTSFVTVFYVIVTYFSPLWTGSFVSPATTQADGVQLCRWELPGVDKRRLSPEERGRRHMNWQLFLTLFLWISLGSGRNWGMPFCSGAGDDVDPFALSYLFSISRSVVKQFCKPIFSASILYSQTTPWSDSKTLQASWRSSFLLRRWHMWLLHHVLLTGCVNFTTRYHIPSAKVSAKAR